MGRVGPWTETRKIIITVDVGGDGIGANRNRYLGQPDITRSYLTANRIAQPTGNKINTGRATNADGD